MGDSTVHQPFRRGAGVRLGGIVRLVHPFPTVLNAMVAGALACVALGGWPGAGRLVWVTATMLTIQSAIGAVNDWADRALDAQAKPWKPIPAGLVSAYLARTLAVLLVGAALTLIMVGPPRAWALGIAGLGIGLAYDLGVKRTPFSAVTYALALPLVPVWVWTAMERDSPALAGILPVGVLLGSALQLANALPDAEADAAAGMRGTLQWLGPVCGRRTAWLTFGAALVTAATLAPLLGLRLWPFSVSWLIAAMLLSSAVLLYRRQPSTRSLQQGWMLLAVAAGVLAVGWLASLP